MKIIAPAVTLSLFCPLEKCTKRPQTLADWVKDRLEINRALHRVRGHQHRWTASSESKGADSGHGGSRKNRRTNTRSPAIPGKARMTLGRQR